MLRYLLLFCSIERTEDKYRSTLKDCLLLQRDTIWSHSRESNWRDHTTVAWNARLCTRVPIPIIRLCPLLQTFNKQIKSKITKSNITNEKKSPFVIVIVFGDFWFELQFNLTFDFAFRKRIKERIQQPNVFNKWIQIMSFIESCYFNISTPGLIC
jgi:hypothetical protein